MFCSAALHFATHNAVVGDALYVAGDTRTPTWCILHTTAAQGLGHTAMHNIECGTEQNENGGTIRNAIISM